MTSATLQKLNEHLRIARLTPAERLQTIADVTVGSDGTSTATGSVTAYNGTFVCLWRFDPTNHSDGYQHDDIFIHVAPDTTIGLERTVDGVLLTRFPTAAVTRVTVAPYAVDTTTVDGLAADAWYGM